MGLKRVLTRSVRPAAIALGAAILLFLVVAGAGWMYLRSDRFSGNLRSIIERRASALLGVPVTIERITLDPSLRSFTVTNLDARAEGADESLLHVNRVSGRIGLRALLSGRTRLETLAVEGVAFDISRADHKWSWTLPPSHGAQEEVEVDEFTLTDGTIHIADRDVPFTAALTGLAFEASGVLGRKLTGSFEAHGGHIESEALGETPLVLSAAFTLTPENLELTKLRVASDWASLEGDALLLLKEKGKGRIRTAGDLHLAPLTAERGSNALRGEVHFEAEIKGGDEGWGVTGTLDGRDLAWRDWSASRVAGPFTWNKAEGLRGGPYEAVAEGGTARATFAIPGELKGAGHAHVDVSGARLSNLLTSLHRDLPLEGAVTASADLDWTALKDIKSWSARAESSLAPITAPGRWPVQGTSRLTLAKGVIGFENLVAHSGPTDVTGSGTFDPFAKTWHMDLVVVSGDLPATVPIVEACSRAFHLDPEPWELRTLAGTGEVRGRVDEAGGVWTSRGTLAGESVEYRGGRWGEVSGSYELDATTIAFAPVVAARGEMRGTIDARFDRRGGGFRLSGAVQNLEAGDALAASGVVLDLEGILSGTFEVSRGGEVSRSEHMQGHVVARSGPGSYLDIPFDDATTDFTFTSTLVDFRSLEARAGQGRVELTGTLAPRHGTGLLTVKAESVDLSLLAKNNGLQGHVTGEGTIESRDGQFLFRGTASGDPVRAGTLAPGAVTGSIESDFHRVTYDLQLPGLAGHLTGTLMVAPPREIDAHLVASGASVDAVLAVLGGPRSQDLSGTVSADLTIRGPLDRREDLVVQGTVSALELFAGTAAFHLAEPVPLLYDDGKAVFRGARLEGTGSRVTLDGSLTSDTPPVMDIAAAGEVDLGVLRLFLPEVTARGTAQIALQIKGHPDDPKVTGTATLSAGRLRRFDFPTAIENLSAELRLDGETVFVERLAADVGGGTVRGSGTIELAAPADAALEGTIRLTTVTLTLPQGFRATWNGLLRLGGTLEYPVVSGELEIAQGVWTRDFGLESFSLFGRGREFSGDVPGSSDLRDRTRLDLSVKANDNLWLRNDLGSVEGRADLTVRGTASQPILTGRVTGFEGGRVRFRRTDYLTREVTVDFDGPRIDNPYLNATADTRVSGYDIVLSVHGELQHLVIAFTSVPSLPQNQIISLLVTGTLGSTEGDLAGSSDSLARSYLGGAVTGFIEEPIENLLSLDTFRITPLTLAGRTDPTTRLTVGKRVGTRLYLHYSRDLTGAADPIYGVEYQFGRKVRGYVESGEEGGVGGDVRYTTRFGVPEPPPAAAAGPPRPPVADVRIEGVGTTMAADLVGKTGVEPGEPFSRNAVAQGRSSVKRALLDMGFLEAQVRSSTVDTPKGTEVVYTITRGRRITVRLEGVPRTQRREVRARLRDLWEEALFTEDLLDAASDEIVDALRTRGHYNAQVQRRTSTDAEGSLEVVFEADPGPLVEVEEVTLSGWNQVDEARIRRQILTRPDRAIVRDYIQPEVIEEDRATIVRLYRSLGFLQADVVTHVTLSPDGEKARIRFQIDEGARALVGTLLVRVNGEPLEPPNPALLLDLVEGAPSSPQSVRAVEDGLRARWDGLGYPDVQVDTVTHRDADAVDVTWNVTTGRAQTVRRIEIEGNELTRDRLIRREVQLEPGDPLSKEKMRLTQQGLYRLGLFETVAIEPVETGKPESGERIVTVRVRDSDNLSLTGGLGYDTEAGPRVTVEFSDSNVRGTGRSLGLQTRVSSKDQRAQLTFVDHRLFGRSADLVLPLFWEFQDKESFQFNRIGASAQIRRRLAPHTEGLLRYNLSIADVSNLAGPILDATEGPLQPGRTRLGSLGASVVWDGRDSPFKPTRGGSLTGDLRVFSPWLGSARHADELPPPVDRNHDGTIDPPKNVVYAGSFVKFYAQGTWQKSLGRGVVLANSARVGLAQPYDSKAGIPLVERYFAGGDTTVRGFPRDLLGSPGRVNSDGTVVGGTIVAGEPVGGEALLVFNQELRFPIRGPLGGEVFYDAGNTYLDVGDVSLSDLRHVFGAGLRLETPVGPVRIEYGRKLDRQPGESPGQFFISIGPSF